MAVLGIALLGRTGRQGDTTTEDAYNTDDDEETPPPRPQRTAMLVCTVGKQDLREYQYPPDGLCDLIFFTDIEYDGDYESTDLQIRLRYISFLVAAYKSVKTEFGVSITHQSISKYAVADNNTLALTITVQRIRHYGILNVTTDEAVNMLSATDPFKVISQVQAKLNPAVFDNGTSNPKRNYIAIGFRHPGSYFPGATFKEYSYPIDTMLDRLPSVNMLIMWTDYDPIRGSGSCVLGGSPWTYPRNRSCLGPSMEDVTEILRSVRLNRGHHTLVSARSFSMSAVRVSLDSATSGFLWNNTVDIPPVETAYTETCQPIYANTTTLMPGEIVVGYNDHTLDAVIYDNLETITNKLEESRRIFNPRHQAWVLTNIPNDNQDSSCNQSAYFRLYGVKQLL